MASRSSAINPWPPGGKDKRRQTRQALACAEAGMVAFVASSVTFGIKQV